MNVPSYIAVAVGGAVVFYLVLPALRARWVSRQWSVFRHAVRQAHYALDLHPSLPGVREGESSQNVYRFFGKLEAMQANEVVWVGNDTLSAVVELSKVPIFVLTHANTHQPPFVVPHTIYWKDIPALAEGTPLFVSGRVTVQHGVTRFVAAEGEDPLVVLHEGGHERFIELLMLCGRRRNNFWNELTPLSLVTGFILEFLLAVFVLPTSRLAATVALVLAFLPVSPLFPPGVVATFLYRRVWSYARTARSRYDASLLVGGEKRRSHAVRLRAYEVVALVILAAGIGANSYTLALLLAYLLTR